MFDSGYLYIFVLQLNQVSMKNQIIGILCFSSLGYSCNFTEKKEQPIVESSHNEIMYHVVQRSFYDSNGDLQGDLDGLTQKLGYLQDLGITSILMLPLYESIYYHNYFSSDFEKIDQEFGAKEDYLQLINAIHQRGMKLYMDMETQYVTEDHAWYIDAYQNPGSKFSNYLNWEDSAQTQPSTIVYDLEGLMGYDSVYRRITTVNLENPEVLQYNIQLFSSWVDPNGDGNFNDGVDGFRLDHMMDDLDNKGRWTNLFETFWKPLIAALRKINPHLVFMAEQADWTSFGIDYLTEAGVDRVFAFRIAFEIRDFNKQKLALMADSIFSLTPKGKNQIVFIENHDMTRFASLASGDKRKIKLGGALNLLMGGIPSIYYGQELGMMGKSEWGHWGMTDANEIPVREAFEWYSEDTGKGTALWYKDSGPWWDSTNLKPDDGISLEEQKNDPGSVWNFYKGMIHLRRTHKSLVEGKFKLIKNNSENIFTFLRELDDRAALVIVNMGGDEEQAGLELPEYIQETSANPERLWGKDSLIIKGIKWQCALPAYAINVWEMKCSKK